MSASTGFPVQHSPDSTLSTALCSLRDKFAIADFFGGFEEIDTSTGDSLPVQHRPADGLDAQIKAEGVSLGLE
jgi:hypothetical protein